jgi:DNA repair protein RadC
LRNSPPAGWCWETNTPTTMETTNELLVLNEVKMVYRNPQLKLKPLVATSAEAYNLLLDCFDATMDMREEFWMLMLDRGNRAKCVFRVSEGGLHGTVADPKMIYAAALKSLASSIILAHNHPSGQLRPSEEDIRLTKKLVEAGRYLDLPVNDHLIMTRQGYYSFADNGML